MNLNVIVLAVALLAVAGALVAVAVALLRRGPRTMERDEPQGAPGHIEIDTGRAGDEESEHGHEELPAYVYVAEKPHVLKVTDLPDGQVEVLVEWDPNHMPSSFRGKTLAEATETALAAIRVKRARQGDEY